MFVVIKLLRRAERFERVAVRIDEEAVQVGRVAYPRASIRNAYWVPAAGHSKGGVRLLGEGGRHLATIATTDADAAAPVLVALGLAPDQRAAPFDSLPPR